MVKRSAPDARSSDISTRLNLTDIAAEYISKFAPPNSSTMAKVQVAMKKLRETAELANVQTLLYKYDITAIRAETKDERICAVYLNQALNSLRSHKYDDAHASLDKVFSILPSYSEAYRIASFVAATEGDLYRAAEELDRALEHSPKSALIYYQFAQLSLYKLDDPGLALEKIDFAIKIDPTEEALHTLRALVLVRLGRCSEAAPIYEELLPTIDQRVRKWRITTRDQASECYRRWAEQDVKMKETDLAKGHLARALEILAGAVAHDDFDERMGRLYVHVVEDALYLARAASDEGYATKVLERYIDASKAVSMPGFQRFSFELLSQSFGWDSALIGSLRDALNLPPSNNIAADVSIVASGEESLRLKGTIKYPINATFCFVRAKGQEWFFHVSDLVDQSDWKKIAVGGSVTFEEGRNENGVKKAARVKLSD
jgi:tetratricopeptide (TPR) repeat protein